ncbi:MAG: flagellar hook-basal body complex protein [Opitutaceae bacterium]
MSLIGTMDSGVSALRTFQKGLEVIGNNIANVNTTGFKSSGASYGDSFSNILQASAPASGAASNTPTIAVGTGVSLSGISTNFGQGSLTSTGNVTDLGVSGNGYFMVKNPTDGSAYATRNGNFRMDSAGHLVTQQGMRVQGLTGGTPPTTVGDITLSTPPSGTELQSVTIDKSGNLIEFYSDGTSATTNQLLLQNFKDQSALTSEGNGMFSGLTSAGPISGSVTLTAADNTPGTVGIGTIQSGTLELSNVDLTQQFSDLITTQRSFQAASRLITVSDTVLEDIVNLKTR